MIVEPWLLDDVISVTPAIRANWRSSGVATEDAIVSGLAPGNDPETCIVGKSTWGRADTGSCVYASAPANAMAAVKRVVATGRWMNGEETLMVYRKQKFRNFRSCCPPSEAAG